ncbi:Transducin/WD40 repeat-like superfamily protein isoform 1 [Hibiscus syriacus]|uniref:Transducin/WD40 repeat-like superfamily protein isoform 1 n=1 Tax=Hibiscus syriacus TaxID=106335 RepID=A0A6A3AHU2_HIBSY|nr:transcription factor bHLH123-like isoform X2 [Hibiscus syriacus]KAE8703207.1 Transducin/WD40 repeat-like superfamily protein isoform 1 [Hibiscus syriacus]
MADEFNTGTNWWDSSRTAGSSSSSSGLNNSLGWATEMADIKAAAAARSSMDSVSSGSSVVFQDNQKLQAMDLQMMGLGLSSQAMDWNQAFLRGEKSETSFRSMLQDHSLSTSNTNYHHQQMNRGFSLDQSQFSPHGSSSDSTVTCHGLPSSFPMDSTAALYGSPSTILQGLLGSENQPQQQQQSSYENRSINYQYGMNTNDQLLPNSWSKVPQFLSSSPPKHHHQQQHQLHGQLHFSNNAPFWNPSAAPMADHVRPGVFPSLQTQFPTGNFDEKPKNISEVRDSSTVVKKSGNEPTSKRPRNENPSTMPAFKVRKEKMGDRITALQQLVSPFGKTDTASVLSEAIEYIKFLHEQVNVLSTPYMKNNEAVIQHQRNPEKSKDPEGPNQDLRSRGLCLVPVSSTFPLTHDSPVDFWTPTFGGTFR